jgi:hypothetical protein
VAECERHTLCTLHTHWSGSTRALLSSHKSAGHTDSMMRSAAGYLILCACLVVVTQAALAEGDLAKAPASNQQKRQPQLVLQLPANPDVCLKPAFHELTKQFESCAIAFLERDNPGNELPGHHSAHPHVQASTSCPINDLLLAVPIQMRSAAKAWHPSMAPTPPCPLATASVSNLSGPHLTPTSSSTGGSCESMTD